MKHVTLRLSDEDVAFVTRLGGGDRSAGIRQAIAAARDQDAVVARLEAQLAQVDNKVTRIGKMLIAGAQSGGQQ